MATKCICGEGEQWTSLKTRERRYVNNHKDCNFNLYSVQILMPSQRYTSLIQYTWKYKCIAHCIAKLVAEEERKEGNLDLHVNVGVYNAIAQVCIKLLNHILLVRKYNDIIFHAVTCVKGMYLQTYQMLNVCISQALSFPHCVGWYCDNSEGMP